MNQRDPAFLLHMALAAGPRVFLLMFVTGLVAGCSLLQTAPDEQQRPTVSGEITVYTTLNDNDTNEYLQMFQARYPRIDVNLVAGTTGIITERLKDEQEAPQADVVWGVSATTLTLLEWHGLLQPYAPEGLERVWSLFRDTSNPPNWVGYGGWMAVFCVNTDILAQKELPMPDSWESLVNAVYEGQIVMPSPASSGTGYLITEGILEIFGEIEGWDYLDQLDKNVVSYTQSGSRPCAMAGDGDIAIGISFGVKATEEKEAGKPIEIIFPTEGSGWDMLANALVKKEEIKPAARAFLDWAISDQAMAAYRRHTSILSVPLEDYEPPTGFPEDPLLQLLDKDFPWATANQGNIVREWELRYGEGAVTR